ncbi:MAG: MFS transporter [Promethearchaeota archaeon]|nr:MAG: MFS transporter [Candidatus Lokiarchaeota archaeon]
MPITKIEKKDLVPIVLVCILLFISTACANMLIPSYSAIKQEFKIAEALIAVPDASFVLISAFFALIWGYYTDRINRTKLIFAGAFSWTIGMLLTGFSINYPMIVISRILSGAGMGCVLPVGYSIISDAIPPDERSGWFGLIAILSSISNGVGQGLSSFLGPILTWRFPFLLLSGISIVIVFVLFFIKLPYRGASETELSELQDWELEYSYRIAKDDLTQIIHKKTNQYLIVQGFFSIIPGTIFIFFLTSLFNLYYFNPLPQKIRLQTSTIFAGLVGIGYLLGNVILSYLGDVVFRRRKKNRAILSTVCMILTVPFCLLMLFSIIPVDVNSLGISYPDPIPTEEISTYLFQTIGKIFVIYPNYVFFFIFALIGSILSSGPVANRNAVMVDVNLPEHKGTAASFFSLSEQVGKGLTLLISYLLITLLGSIYNMMIFSVFFWIPAGFLWFLASRNVEEDMEAKNRILKERKQMTLIDYVFELEVQLDRAIQKIQDTKYYLKDNESRALGLLTDAINILNYCERRGEYRSITDVESKARELKQKAIKIKDNIKDIYSQLHNKELQSTQRKHLHKDLEQIKLFITESFPQSSFGIIQTYYEDAYLKITEAYLLDSSQVFEILDKIERAIRIYNRVKHLLDERIEEIGRRSDLTEEDNIALEKEKKLYQKTENALWATLNLKNKINDLIQNLETKGIERKNLKKIAELTSEYNLNLRKVILETFRDDKETRTALLLAYNKIMEVFKEFYEIYDLEDLKVF